MAPNTRTSSSTSAEVYIDVESTLEAFFGVRNIVKCTGCPAVGKFILNGSTSHHQTIQCKPCGTNYSGRNLREIIHCDKATKKSNVTAKSSAATRSKSGNREPSSELFAVLKLANDKLAKDNASFKLQLSKVLDAQRDDMDHLRDENRDLRSQLATLIDQNKYLQNTIDGFTTKMYTALEELKKLQVLNPTTASVSEEDAQDDR